MADLTEEFAALTYSEDTPGMLVVRLAGEVDLSAIRRLQSKIDVLLEQDADQISVDVSGVTFMDTSGISLLVQLCNRFVRMKTEGASALVARAIEALGLREYLGLVSDRKASRSFAPVPDSVGGARRFLAEVMGTVLGPKADVAQLLLSELATNALLNCPTDFQVALHYSSAEARVRIGVTDAAAALPVLSKSTVNEVHGRGLLIVAALADGWGVEPVAAGKTVWFELSVVPTPSEL